MMKRIVGLILLCLAMATAARAQLGSNQLEMSVSYPVCPGTTPTTGYFLQFNGTCWTAAVGTGGTGGTSSVTGTANQILASPTSGSVVLTLIGPYTPATFGAHAFIAGEGTSSLSVIGPCATGTIPYGQGASADPICSALAYPNAATTGDLVIATGTNALGSLADVATTKVLMSGGVGVAPAYQAISGDATIGATGALTVTKTSGVALGTFATQNFATPPIIGVTTPANIFAADLTYSSVTNNCKGSVTLATGVATVTNACINASSFPLCVDTSAANQVACTPGNGTMSVSGTLTDVIKWIIVG